MAWTNLRTDYTDAEWSGKKKYKMTENSDGTVSFDDVTTYTKKENSFFGAKDANQMNEAMNIIANNLADKETLDKIYALLATEPVYGFIEHNGILAPEQRIEYIGANKDYSPITVTMGGGYSLGDWADHPWLKANKPYMVRSDGTADYQLDENDYTKREDGTESDVSNTDYDGGAFAWAKKIYKQEYTAGDDRYVLFSMTPREGFEPVGFKLGAEEVEGVWLPMFDGAMLGDRMTSLAGTQPAMNQNTDTQWEAIQAFSNRARFMGGPLYETLVDLMLLFAKTTELQTAYGLGNSSGYVNDPTQNYGIKANAVVNGGQFYGTSDGKSLNKVFHCIPLITQSQYKRDPYLLCINGRLKVSNEYNYDLSGATYADTGIDVPVPETSGWSYPHKYHTVPGWGWLPVYPYLGSSAVGGCDGIYQSNSQDSISAVALRVAYGGLGRRGGPRALSLYFGSGFASWGVGAALYLFPPVGAAV